MHPFASLRWKKSQRSGNLEQGGGVAAPGWGSTPAPFFCRSSGNISWWIPVASKSDEGFYECTATSKVGVTRARAYVSVSGGDRSCQASVPTSFRVCGWGRSHSTSVCRVCRATTASRSPGQRHSFTGPRRGHVLSGSERRALQPDVELGREGSAARGWTDQAAAEPLTGDQPRAAGGRGPVRVCGTQCPRHCHRLPMALCPG